MARTRSLAQLRGDVADRADITVSTAGRHTTVNMNRRINEAIQRYVRMVSKASGTFYVKQSVVSTSASATVDAANWAPRDYLALPSDFYELLGIDLTFNGTTYSLDQFGFDERNQFREYPAWMQTNGVGIPVMYELSGSNAAGTRIVKVIPSSDGVYSCVIWYLPVVADLTADADTFDFIAGYDEWVVNRAVMDSLLRDGTSPAYAAAQAENAQLEAAMNWEFATQSGAKRRIDTLARRATSARFSRGLWGWQR